MTSRNDSYETFRATTINVFPSLSDREISNFHTFFTHRVSFITLVRLVCIPRRVCTQCSLIRIKERLK